MWLFEAESPRLPHRWLFETTFDSSSSAYLMLAIVVLFLNIWPWRFLLLSLVLIIRAKFVLLLCIMRVWVGLRDGCAEDGLVGGSPMWLADIELSPWLVVLTAKACLPRRFWLICFLIASNSLKVEVSRGDWLLRFPAFLIDWLMFFGCILSSTSAASKLSNDESNFSFLASSTLLATSYSNSSISNF